MKTNTKHWAGITAGILSLAGYASAASLGSEKYTYDASGNIVEKSSDGQVSQMTYDPSNRLTERQATGQSKETTAYDAAGRPISMKDGTGQPTRSMSYGYGDKVVETKNDGTYTGFYYNAEGQLVGKKTSSGVATYTWDGNVLAADASETFTNEAHITGGIPAISGEKTVVVSDYLGNTLSQGCRNLLGNAYGEGLEEGRFTGKLFVKELGGFVFQHRLYSPSASQWTIPDPSGYPDGYNNYAYLEADPVGAIDINGLSTTPITYTWTYKVNSNPVATGKWDGTSVWSVAVGSESGKISEKPGWIGQNTYELTPKNGDTPAVTVTAIAAPDDLTSWDYNFQNNQKQYHIFHKVHFTENTSGSSPTITFLKTEENEQLGPWIEM